MTERNIYLTTKNTELGNLNIKIRVKRQTNSEFIGSTILYGTLENSQDVVCKLSEIPGGAEREWEGLQIAFLHGISTPTPIALVEFGEKATEGIISEEVSGNLFNNSNSTSLEFSLGQLTKELHQIPQPGWGVIKQGIPEFKSPLEYYKKWLEMTLPQIGNNQLKPNILLELFNRGRGHILTQPPVFIHKDLKDSNIIVTPKNSLVIFDFEWWQGGNPLEDVGVRLYHSIRSQKPNILFQNFLEGYFGKTSLTSLELYDLMFHTIFSAARVVSFTARRNISFLDEAKSDYIKTESYIRNLLLSKQ